MNMQAIEKINTEMQKNPTDQYTEIVGQYIIDRCTSDTDGALVAKEGKTLAVLSPACDPLPELETALSAIYGPVSLTACVGRDGRRHLVMLSEEREEDEPWNL